MSRDYSFVHQGSTLNVVLDDGRSFTWPKTHPNFDAVVGAILNETATSASLADLMDTRQRVANAATGFDNVSVSLDGVYIDGELINNTLTDRIVSFTAEGYDVGPMVTFLVNLRQNPSFASQTELYGFLLNSQMPITEDGCFIAYKIVRNDYMDCYSGKFDNSPGKVVQMKRFEVDDNRNNTCSRGLHVCSKAYLPHYGSAISGSDRIVIVKINPADVVSVPADYNDAKMRVWRYEVIGELNAKDKAGVFEKKGIFRTQDHNDGSYATWHGMQPTSSAAPNETMADWDDSEEDDHYCGECGNDESYCSCDEDEEEEVEENVEKARDDAQAALFVKDDFDDEKFYPATVLDIRSKNDLYVYNSTTGEYDKV